MFPSPVPTHITPSFTSEGAIVRIVPRACFKSFSSGRTRVRSPLTASQLVPPSLVFSKNCVPRYSRSGSRVVHHIRAQRIGNRVSTFAWPDWVPVALRDLSIVSAARDSRGSAVLLWPVHPIGKPMVRCAPVEFSRWLVVPGAPRFPSVQADRRSLVHSQHDSL